MKSMTLVIENVETIFAALSTGFAAGVAGFRSLAEGLTLMVCEIKHEFLLFSFLSDFVSPLRLESFFW